MKKIPILIVIVMILSMWLLSVSNLAMSAGDVKSKRSNDLPEPVRITNNAETQNDHAIWGNKIIWTENGDIHIYDLGPDGEYRTEDDTGEKQITTYWSKYYPDIFENKIVWVSYENMFDRNIYIYKEEDNT